jgi:hypothetical protein
MGFRFSRRIKIMPGVRINVGLRGASVSVGPRGASVTVGRGGAHANVGLPGTGLSYRTRLGGAPQRRAASGGGAGVQVPDRLQVRFGPGTELALLDDGGSALVEPVLSAAVRAYRPQLLELLDARATEVSEAEVRALDVHIGTPQPGEAAACGPAFAQPKPVRPRDPREIDAGSLQRVQAETAWSDYMEKLAAWRAAKAEHEKRFGAAPDTGSVLSRVEARLARLEWPRETLVSIDLAGDGRQLLADIDLPELEDMPSGTLSVSRRDAALVEKPLSEANQRRLYRRHVHAILFRVIGEAFAAAPAIGAVQIAGYTQRLSRATGAVEDEYVLAVRVARADWGRIAFSNLEAVDPEAALALFDRRCASDASGAMRPIDRGF